MRLRRVVIWTGAISVMAVAAIAVVVVNSVRKESSVSLVSCMEAEHAALAWVCKRVLHARSITPAEIQQLNRQAGAIRILGLTDRAEAKLVLEKFLAGGLDVNAIDEATGTTALHTLVSSRDLEDIRLLLSHGARTDIRDRRGYTPLETASALQERHPELGYGRVVALLKEHRVRSAQVNSNP